MTIQSDKRISGPFVGDDSTVNLDFDYVVFEADDLRVFTRDANNVDTDLVLTTDYSVALNEDQDVSPGGRVVLVAALATGLDAYVESDVDYLQESVFTNTGAFYPSVLNKALDKIHTLLLQLKAGFDRTLTVPHGETGLQLPAALTRAGNLLGFDSLGNISLTLIADTINSTISDTQTALQGYVDSAMAWAVGTEPGGPNTRSSKEWAEYGENLWNNFYPAQPDDLDGGIWNDDGDGTLLNGGIWNG